MRKFCIVNTCGLEDCGNHEIDHEHGAYYLVQDVDARIAELEQVADQLRGKLYGMYVLAGYAQHEAHEMAHSL